MTEQEEWEKPRSPDKNDMYDNTREEAKHDYRCAHCRTKVTADSSKCPNRACASHALIQKVEERFEEMKRSTEHDLKQRMAAIVAKRG